MKFELSPERKIEDKDSELESLDLKVDPNVSREIQSAILMKKFGKEPDFTDELENWIKINAPLMRIALNRAKLENQNLEKDWQDTNNHERIISRIEELTEEAKVRMN
ncbi:MAG: hypothetical protein Q8O98_02250 [bacterium]|nr:hypothetical protein [bacterium]